MTTRPDESAAVGGASIRILSLGGGTQSSALALMSADGLLPKLDAVVFADTQGEMPATYLYVDYLRLKLAEAGIPLLTVTRGSLEGDIYAKGGRGSQPTPPLHLVKAEGAGRVNGYTCSYDYKRRVVTAEVKRLCGGRGAWKRSTVEQWIGYSTDEISRIKQVDECRCGHKRTRAPRGKFTAERIHTDAGCSRCSCEGFTPWQVNRWPLIELGMTRGDAQRWIASHGHPLPPRSACWFCPNRGNGHWRNLKDDHPDLWARAVALDEFVRDGCSKLKGQGFLHGSRVPLANADLRTTTEREAAQGQDSLFDESEVTYDCDAGVCFT